MTTRLVLAGADVVLPDRVLAGAMPVIEDGRIVDILPRPVPTGSGAGRDDAHAGEAQFAGRRRRAQNRRLDLAILDSRMSVADTCIAGHPCLGRF